MRNLSETKALLLLPLFFYLVCSDTEGSTAPMEKAEKEALYSVIQGFVGAEWNGSSLFPDPCGWTMIQGISCDLFNGHWYITEISIGPILENSLECSRNPKFSAKLFELKHLRSLTFFNCFTSSSPQPTIIPSENWNKLAASLEMLEFRSNQGLTGGITSIFSQLNNLNSLVLVDNTLKGELPQELANLMHLKRLVLSGNQFFGQIPASLGNNLSQLLVLDLSRNSLSGTLPALLGGLSSLIKLDLSNNLFNGSVPSEFGKLKNLTLLDLRNNMLSGGLSQSLQEMSSLQDLLLSNNPLSGNIMSFGWRELKNLSTLDLSNTGLEGNIPESITELRRLRYLGLANNHLSGSVPSKLAALPWLNSLYLNGNDLTGVLEFPEKFYERMGRRFASWNNSKLCYTDEVLFSGHAPLGVEQCKHEQDASAYNSDHKAGYGNPYQNSSFKAPFWFSTSLYGFWLVILVQEVLVVSVLILML